MGFAQYYNWLKYNFFSPSFFFKNRLHLERNHKNKFIYSHFNITYKGFNWSSYQSINLSTYPLAYLKNIYIVIIVMSILIILGIYLYFKGLLFLPNLKVIEYFLYIFWRIFDTLYFWFFNSLYVLLTIFFSWVFLAINSITPANLSIYKIISRHFLDESLSFNHRYWDARTLPEIDQFIVSYHLSNKNIIFKKLNQIKYIEFIKNFYQLKSTFLYNHNYLDLILSHRTKTLLTVPKQKKLHQFHINQNSFLLHNSIKYIYNFFLFSSFEMKNNINWFQQLYTVEFSNIQRINRWLLYSTNFSTLDLSLINNLNSLMNNIIIKKPAKRDLSFFYSQTHQVFLSIKPKLLNNYFNNTLNINFNKEWLVVRNQKISNYAQMNTASLFNLVSKNNANDEFLINNNTLWMSILYYNNANFEFQNFNNSNFQKNLQLDNNFINYTVVNNTIDNWKIQDLSNFYLISTTNSKLFFYSNYNNFWYLYFFRDRYLGYHLKYKKKHTMALDQIKFFV